MANRLFVRFCVENWTIFHFSFGFQFMEIQTGSIGLKQVLMVANGNGFAWKSSINKLEC